MAQDRFTRFVRLLTTTIAQADDIIKTFTDQLTTDNPLYGFEWGERALDAAAAKTVYGRYLGWTHGLANTVDQEAMLANILKDARDQAMNLTRMPQISSSEMANAASRAKAKSFAEIASRLEIM